MATIINPDAIQDVSRAAKRNIKRYVSPKPIIVGRAIPRNAEVGDRYYTSSLCVHIKMPSDIAYNSYNVCLNVDILRVGVYLSKILFTVPNNWPEIYDAIAEMALRQGITETDAVQIRELVKPYVKSVPTLTSATASPEVTIQNGRLVYTGVQGANIITTKPYHNLTYYDVFGNTSIRKIDIRVYRSSKIRQYKQLGSNFKKRRIYHRATKLDRRSPINDVSSLIKRSFVVRKKWRNRLKAVCARYFAVYKTEDIYHIKER